MGSWALLVMSTQDPTTGKWKCFVDKCLPFGSSISCSHFQRVSNGIKHIVQTKTGSTITNYLDDFLFLALTILRCNYLVDQFLLICKEINFPVSFDKTEWASELLIFLEILLNGWDMVLSVPLEKKEKAVSMLQYLLDKSKATVKELQVLCRYLNFLNKAIFPRRAFTW